MTERFFILTPTATDQPDVYLDASGKPMKWSGKFPIPAIGTRVFVVMNRIGWAVVKGYFESDGYVGLMTLPTRPPKWLRDQRKRETSPNQPAWVRDGIGCEFGMELSLKRPVPKPRALETLDGR